MIRDALVFILELMNTFIKPVNPGNVDDMVVMGNIAMVDAYNDVAAEMLNNKIVVSIVNIEQESSLRNLPYSRAGLSEDGEPRVVTRQPTIYLNLYVLFCANNTKYDNALFYISKVIAFFQRRFSFSADTHPALANLGIEKLIFDLHSMSFEQMNNLWGMLGGKVVPCVMYKVRLVAIQEADEEGGGLVEAIRSNENSL